jgi:hypothetical protein
MSDPNHGRHNADLDAAKCRLIKANTYKDASTVIVVVTRGMIHARVVQCWMSLMAPMNQKCFRIFVTHAEVGDGYNQAIEMILGNEELSKFEYMLTIEEDNLPPPDGHLKLLESIVDFDAVGGLYWTKGDGGMPMCYGQPSAIPKNFIPWLPPPGTVAQCNGLGMGFTLFRMAMFKKMPKPWFKTVQDFTPGVGAKAFTQDLWFFQEAAKFGYRFASDTRCLVGHFDPQTGIVW